MAKPRKGGHRGVSRPKKGGQKVRIPSGGSYGGGYKRHNAAGGPASTPSNQWADVWARKISGHKTRKPGSGSSGSNYPRRG
jgi:hypothetical protein